MSTVDVKREGKRVEVRSVFFVLAFPLMWMVGLAAMTAHVVRSEDIRVDNPFLWGVGLMFGFGLFATLHRTILTSFDGSKGSMVQQRFLCGVWRWRERSYSFGEIAGVGVHQWDSDDGKQFSLLATLKNGETVRLVHHDIDRSDCYMAAENICAATGIPRADTSWKDERSVSPA
jgi:hypothetical protein